MKAIKITKLKEVANARTPLNIMPGEIFYGTFIENPQIGERFNLNAINFDYNKRGFSTSGVVKILSENTFRTYNSIYKWESIELDDNTFEEIKK